MNKIYLSAKTIVGLMVNLSELIIIMGKYLGIYAKDSLDELLLTTHHSSTYRGKSREVERRAFSKWLLDGNNGEKIEGEESSNVAKILGHMSDDGEWIITAKGQDPIIKDDVCWDSNDYNYNEDNLGDSFPYISHPK